MDEKFLIEIIKTSLSCLGSTINQISGAIIAILFLRKNTRTSEFEKIKCGRMSEVVDRLLQEGKMTYLEFYKCNNYLEIAKKADEAYSKNHCSEQNHHEDYNIDWFLRFYDYASNISDTDAQTIWASILAKEVLEPGTISYSLLHSMFMISPTDARFFCNISRFALQDYDFKSAHLLLFVSSSRRSYELSGITPDRLKRLERLGLIECDFENEYVFTKKKVFRSGNHIITVFGDPSYHDRIKAGNVVFTDEGQLLYSLVDDDYKRFRNDILSFSIERFKMRNCKVVVDEKAV